MRKLYNEEKQFNKQFQNAPTIKYPNDDWLLMEALVGLENKKKKAKKRRFKKETKNNEILKPILENNKLETNKGNSEWVKKKNHFDMNLSFKQILYLKRTKYVPNVFKLRS